MPQNEPINDPATKASPRDHAQSALVEAAAHLRPSLRTDGSRAAGGGSVEQQWDALERFAAQNRLILPAAFPPPDRHGGAEHDVRFDPVTGRWWKYTSPGFAGLTVDWDATSDPILRLAAPAEYLCRLVMQNESFSDDITLEGLWFDEAGGGLRIVTSQPDVAGEPATLNQITDSLGKMGFQKLPFPGIGRAGALAFKLGSMALWDAHPANFFVTNDNAVVPIDLILTNISMP